MYPGVDGNQLTHENFVHGGGGGGAIEPDENRPFFVVAGVEHGDTGHGEDERFGLRRV